jgi:hypothetical protein
VISYRAVVRNIQLNGIYPDLKKLKSFIEEYHLGGEDNPPVLRRYSFKDIGFIISAKSRYVT